ncbi:SDR family oxidoreductase [Dietzia sp. KRD202]|uniref:SDR family oxidoreductase n=1 Tax=Dietzia sp. KRD202 TaxID=2729732 RepID=UPI0019D049DC|nr:SDR family oxidoreductase [Dietzia sp. KRD202]
MSLRFPSHPDASERPALVTGASSGIGRASAESLAALGHPVVVGARRADRLDDLVRTIREAGGEATAREVDVTDADSVAGFVVAAADAYGPAEVLVSSAGSLKMARVWEMDPDDFAAQIDIHLLAVHRLLHAVLPGMIDRRRGDVVLIGSDVAYTARPRSGAYVAAKAGLETMAKQARRELEGTGVRLGVVRPGPVMTEMGTEFDQDTAEAVINEWVRHGFGRHPRMCKPADLARGVTAMVSMPRGAQITELEIQPEAPIEEDYS